MTTFSRLKIYDTSKKSALDSVSSLEIMGSRMYLQWFPLIFKLYKNFVKKKELHNNKNLGSFVQKWNPL